MTSTTKKGKSKQSRKRERSPAQPFKASHFSITNNDELQNEDGFNEALFSNLPIFDDQPDDLNGIIHTTQILPATTEPQSGFTPTKSPKTQSKKIFAKSSQIVQPSSSKKSSSKKQKKIAQGITITTTPFLENDILKQNRLLENLLNSPIKRGRSDKNMKVISSPNKIIDVY